jgi:hypothetical protein
MCSVKRPNYGKRSIAADELCDANYGKRSIFHALQAADVPREARELWNT